MQIPQKHVCEMCSLPIRIYGRLTPCKHVFCIQCAEKTKSNGSCMRCYENVANVKSYEFGNIFVCSFGGCNQKGISECGISYLTLRDLNAHSKHKHEKKGYKTFTSEQVSDTSDGKTAQPLMSISIRPQYNGGIKSLLEPLDDLTSPSQLNNFSDQAKSPDKSIVLNKDFSSIQPLMSIPVAANYNEVGNSVKTPMNSLLTEPISLKKNLVPQMTMKSETRSPVIDRGLPSLMSIPTASQYEKGNEPVAKPSMNLFNSGDMNKSPVGLQTKNDVNISKNEVGTSTVTSSGPQSLMSISLESKFNFNPPVLSSNSFSSLQHSKLLQLQQPKPLVNLPYSTQGQQQSRYIPSHDTQNNGLRELPPPWGRVRR